MNENENNNITNDISSNMTNNITNPPNGNVSSTQRVDLYNNLYVDNTLEETEMVGLNKSKQLGTGKIVGIIVITAIISVVASVSGMIALFKAKPDMFHDTVTNITKTEKEVTVTDNGIADAVDKIRDSVVIVKTYVNDKLYATGTGFTYKKEKGKYYFISNYHVIDKGDQIRVQFADESEAVVKIENGDKYADIVVLSIETNADYKVAEMGSNVDMRVGDTVFAIGSPLDYSVFSWSVTRGILSGKDREVEVSIESSMSDYIMQVLQTDTAINEGNSGGPLCNVNGEVIGVTNMKLASEKIEGMGFAIPIEVASAYADAVINGEDVSKPYLGVSMSNANTAAAVNKYSIEMQEGVIIEEVTEGSPSDKAGLKVGDIIKKLDDQDIKDVASLRFRLYKYKVGDVVSVVYVRNGVTKTTELKLEAKK